MQKFRSTPEIVGIIFQQYVTTQCKGLLRQLTKINTMASKASLHSSSLVEVTSANANTNGEVQELTSNNPDRPTKGPEMKKNLQPTSEAKCLPNSYIATENQPINIENNSGVINISACGKCSQARLPDSPDLNFVTDQETNINVNIKRNFGIVIATLTGKSIVIYVPGPDTTIHVM
jgi:hypothetical protein